MRANLQENLKALDRERPQESLVVLMVREDSALFKDTGPRILDHRRYDMAAQTAEGDHRAGPYSVLEPTEDCLNPVKT